MGNEVPEGILEEVVALNQIFQNEDELAREGDGGRVGPFTAEITAYGKVKNIPSRWNLDLGGLEVDGGCVILGIYICKLLKIGNCKILSTKL